MPLKPSTPDELERQSQELDALIRKAQELQRQIADHLAALRMNDRPVVSAAPSPDQPKRRRLK
jgi:hypothetical protein